MAGGGTIRVAGLRVDMSMETAQLVQGIMTAKGAFSQLEAGIISMNAALEIASKANMAFGAITGLLDQAASVDRLTNSFQQLQVAAGANSVATMNDLRTATDGTVTDMGLMRVENQALLGGLNATSQGFMDFAGAAIKLGGSMNVAPEEALQKAIDAVSKARANGLKTWGIYVGAIKDGMTVQQKQAEIEKAVIVQAQKLGPAADTAAMSNEKLSVAVKNLGFDFLAAFSANTELNTAVKSLLDSVDGGAPQIISIGNALGGLAAKAIQAAVALANVATNLGVIWAQQTDQHFELISEGANQVAKDFISMAASGETDADTLDTMKMALRELHKEVDTMTVTTNRGLPVQQMLRSELTQMDAEYNRIVKSAGTATAIQNAWSHALDVNNQEVKGAGAAQASYQKALQASNMEIAKMAGSNGIQLLSQKDQDEIASLKSLALQFQENSITGADYAAKLTALRDAYIGQGLSAKEADARLVQWKQDAGLAGDEAKKLVTSVNQATTAVGTFASTITSALGIALPTELVKGIENTLDKSGAWKGILASLFGTNEDGTINAATAQMTMGIAGSIGTGLVTSFTSGMSSMNASKATGAMASTYANSFIKGFESNLTTRLILDSFTMGLNEVFNYFSQDITNCIFGTMDAQSQQRRQVAKYFDSLFNGQDIKLVIENQLADLKGIDMSKYMPTNMTGSLSAQATSQFGAVGDYFSTVENGFAGMGDQMTNILEHQVGGSLINLKVLLDDLGISAQDMGKAISDSYMKGNTTAQQFLTDSKSIASMTSGDVGSMTQAWTDFKTTATAGGNYAQESLKEIGFEASQIHATSLQDLSTKLTQITGDPAAVQAFIAEMQKMGISLKDLGNMTPTQLAQFVSDLQGANFAFTPLTKDAQDLKATLDSIGNGTYTAQVNINTTLTGATTALQKVTGIANGAAFTDSSFTQTIKMASGGIINQPTMLSANTLAGEAGPEAVMPLKRINGKLGVSAQGFGSSAMMNQTIINVDARGAAPGVEARVMAAVRMAEARAVNKAVTTVVQGMSRGRF